MIDRNSVPGSQPVEVSRRPAGRVLRSQLPRGAALTLVVLLGGVAAVLAVGKGPGKAEVRFSVASAWLVSNELGLVTYVNGTSGLPVSSVVAGESGHRLEATHGNSATFVSNLDRGTVQRLDVTHGVPSRPRKLGGPGLALRVSGPEAYVVDAEQGLVTRIHPQTLALRGDPADLRAEFDLPTGIDSFTLDAGGTLWAAVNARGVVVPVRGGVIGRPVTVASPRDIVTLTLVDGRPFVLDATQGTLRPVSASGAGAPVRLPTPAGAPSALLVSPTNDGPAIPVLVPSSGTLVMVDVATGQAVAATAVGSGGDFGPPVRYRDRVYIPDNAAGHLVVYDTVERRVLDEPRKVAAGAAELDVFVLGEMLWANDVAGPGALVLHGDAERTIRKYVPGTDPRALPGTDDGRPRDRRTTRLPVEGVRPEATGPAASPSPTPWATPVEGTPQPAPASSAVTTPPPAGRDSGADQKSVVDHTTARPAPTGLPTPDAGRPGEVPSAGPNHNPRPTVRPGGGRPVATTPAATPLVSPSPSIDPALLERGHSGPVADIAFSRDGAWLVSGADGEVIVWDLSDPARPVRHATVLGDDVGQHVDITPDGRTIATARGTMVSIWDISDPRQPRRTMTIEVDPLLDPSNPLALSPDGRTLAVLWNDGIRLWDIIDPSAPRLRAIVDILVGGSLYEISFSPDGRYITYLERNSNHDPVGVDVSDLDNPREISVDYPWYDDIIQASSGAWSPDGALLAVGLADGVPLIDFSDPTGPRAVANISEDYGGAPVLAFDRDSEMLVIGGLDRTELWNVADPANPRRIGTMGEVFTDVAFSPNGPTMVTAGPGNKIRFWDVTDPARPVEIVAR